MTSSFKRWIMVTLRGTAQITFAERPIAGVLVLGAIAAVAPWSALGAAIGAAAGTVAGRFQRTLSEVEWETGLAGPNPAIVGILWGGAFATDRTNAGLLVLALLGCIGLEHVFRPIMRKARLPALSAPAMVTVYLVASIYTVFGGSYWSLPAELPFGDVGIAAAVIFIGAAMATVSVVATLQTAILVASAALISGWVWGTGVIGPAGLWAFCVAPAAFGIHAIFLAGSVVGAWAGLIAAALSAVIWVAWVSSPLIAVLPPLLVPFIVAVWVIMAFVLRAHGPLVFEPGLWVAAAEIRRARAAGRPVVVLSGAGISTASGIPDYISGSWLHPEIPVSAYSFERFMASPRCRREYWDACGTFREVAGKARPNPGHGALARLEARGWVAATVTQNVDGLHQAAGACSVVELHGRISDVGCLSCGWRGEWPPDGAWQHYDLHCPDCSGLLKPAVIAMGENIPPAVWQAAEGAIAACGVLMVVGSQMAVSSALELLAQARRAGSRIIVISVNPQVHTLAPDDIVLSLKAEDALPALALLLDCMPGRAE